MRPMQLSEKNRDDSFNIVIQPEQKVGKIEKEYQEVALTSKSHIQEATVTNKANQMNKNIKPFAPKALTTNNTITKISAPILNVGLEDYDKAVRGNTQYVTDYIKDIEKHLKASEV
jgi:type IV secretory pathway VirB6-like protein